ncbi:MAG: hypothetical protein ACREUQ_15520, partial [Burkholderiales bacterium]
RAQFLNRNKTTEPRRTRSTQRKSEEAKHEDTKKPDKSIWIFFAPLRAFVVNSRYRIPLRL